MKKKILMVMILIGAFLIVVPDSNSIAVGHNENGSGLEAAKEDFNHAK